LKHTLIAKLGKEVLSSGPAEGLQFQQVKAGSRSLAHIRFMNHIEPSGKTGFQICRNSTEHLVWLTNNHMIGKREQGLRLTAGIRSPDHRAFPEPAGASEDVDDIGLLGVHRLPAKSEPVPNLCDALIARSLSSELDCAVRLALAPKIHFFSTDVTRCLTLYKVGFLPRDSPSITVRCARK